ncbi:MAG TPA: hypothetical protein VGS57_13305 [Thermoanaerobaculia bacterium]|nr:hypothetical protein [Thermoanaerobaculia bacterium]
MTIGTCFQDVKCRYIRSGNNFIADPNNPSWCAPPVGGCGGIPNCASPLAATAGYDVIPGGGGTYTVRRLVDVKAQYNWYAGLNCHPVDCYGSGPIPDCELCGTSNPWKNINGRLRLTWTTSGGGNTSFCDYFSSDETYAYIQASGLTCAGAPYTLGPYDLRASVCSCANPMFCAPCGRATTIAVDFQISKAQLGCPLPPPSSCGEPSGGSSGASGASCESCVDIPGPGGCSTGIEGKSLSCTPDGSGPNTLVHFRHLGPGSTGLPGATAWRVNLGQGWSHDYAQRIVPDPSSSHVWLVTARGSFREFSNLAAGSGLRLYQTVSPSDEYRRLYLDDPDGDGVGSWRLVSLDGRTDYFLGSGLWDQAVFSNDSHALSASYDSGTGYLSSVALRDGRREEFVYHASGRLWKIREVGVGPTPPTREWIYLWSNSNAGDELVNISRPDGTSFELVYDPTTKYLTQVRLIATDLSSRVVARFEYDSSGNVLKSWRGDPDFANAAAVDKRTFSYTNATFPTNTTVVDGLGNQTIFEIGRDGVAGTKAKVLSREGSCPSCGLPPKVRFEYDSTRPLLRTAMLDARTPTVRTEYTYDANGRRLSMKEAVGLSLERTTNWAYYPTAPFQGVVTEIKQPSTTTGPTNFRRLNMTVDATTGNVSPRTSSGIEGGVAFSYDTAFVYNGSGEVTSIDPPGTGDTVTLTYNLLFRNEHVLDSRVDPLVGTTSFGYDLFNQRTTVTDVNGVVTSTLYDQVGGVTLRRVKEVRRLGAIAADDLVTGYTYSVFGDLSCTKLPRGNGIEYVYDAAGRMVETIRGTAVLAPTSTSCLDPAQPRERARYDLDNEGNRVARDLQRAPAGGSFGAVESRTTYAYTCHLDKVTQGEGGAAPSVTEYCYDLNGNLEKVWDANHQPKASFPNPTQLYEYDDLNRLKKITVGPGVANAATSYTYDVQDHLASVTDAEANLTTYTTSDRDLMTQQVSPVAGTTTYTYNERGQLRTTTDARSVVDDRTLDAADRVTQETFGPSGSPDATLTNTYTYGTTAAQFDIGRLIGITRNGQTISYTYDRFGRMLQDGGLVYEYDKNGYRKKITYPGGVSAIFTPDFADRDSTLSYDTGAGAQALVTAAAYSPGGPLTSLTLANSLVETRSYDTRYYPDRIQAGGLLDWDYTVDLVGNPTAITGSIASVTYGTTFGYQDALYFLTQGDGPWGNRGWTYDKVGNRLTAARMSEPTVTYCYGASCPGTAGHNPKLATMTPAPGWGTGSWTLGYDAAGNQTSVVENNGEDSAHTASYDIAADGRVKALRSSGPTRTDLLYDGRGYLRNAHQTSTSHPTDFIDVTPTYGSSGVLMSRAEARQWTSGDPDANGEDLTSTASSSETTQVFYFAGRPVAQLTSGPELLYITTDALGTPVLATTTSGAAAWAGGLEPFGAVWTAGADNPDSSSLVMPWDGAGAPGSEKRTRGVGVRGVSGPQPSPIGKLSSERLFLRYPGQWSSDAFRVTGTNGDLYYNVNRWFEPQTGRYSTPDPLGANGVITDPLQRAVSLPPKSLVRARSLGLRLAPEQVFAYALQSPERWADPFGLSVCDTLGPGPSPGCLEPGSGCCAAACIHFGRAALCKLKENHRWVPLVSGGIGAIGGFGAAAAAGLEFGPGAIACGVGGGAIGFGIGEYYGFEHLAGFVTIKWQFEDCFHDHCGVQCSPDKPCWIQGAWDSVVRDVIE